MNSSDFIKPHCYFYDALWRQGAILWFTHLLDCIIQVETPTGSSTVYVHGFGTDDSYHDSYSGHHGAHGTAYGYGHIDPYLNHKQGYGYTKPAYAYNSLYAAPHAGHAGPGHHVAGHHLGVAHHGLGAGHHLGVVGHHAGAVVGHHDGAVVGHHGAPHHVAAGYGAGYGAPQPFVGSGFRSESLSSKPANRWYLKWSFYCLLSLPAK